MTVLTVAKKITVSAGSEGTTVLYTVKSAQKLKLTEVQFCFPTGSNFLLGLAIQRGPYRVCPKEGLAGHQCTATCHVYGFHAFRYAHARFNYANPELQNQMGHAYAGTTDHYRRWGEREMGEYGASLPAALEGGKEGRGRERENSGTGQRETESPGGPCLT